MRAINIFFFLSLILLQGCATIEVAKEVTKATNSVKTSIDNIISKEKPTDDNVKLEKNENDEIDKEKEKIISEKIAKTNQKKITTINLKLKTLEQITKIIGQPSLIRVDGNTKTTRFDTVNCRLFIYFNIKDKVMKSQYYEIRNINGSLVEKKEKIKKCYQELERVI